MKQYRLLPIVSCVFRRIKGTSPDTVARAHHDGGSMGGEELYGFDRCVGCGNAHFHDCW